MCGGVVMVAVVANFLLVHFPETGQRSAEAADAFLKDRRIILRRVTSYGFPGALRLTVGSEDENRAVVEALGDFMAGGGTT